MASPPARVTVQVAVQSPSRLLRDTLSACLDVRPDVSVVGMVAEPDQMPDLCELRRPDVVIFDAGLQLGRISGIADLLLRRFPDLNVIATYREASEEEVSAACRAGVASLVPESHGLDAVMPLLRRRRGRHAKPQAGGLTDRELEILVLAGSGHSVAETAALLGISPLTVGNLRRRIYAKLEVSSGAHAVSRAAALGILDRPGQRRTRRQPPSTEFPVLTVVSGPDCAARDDVVAVLSGSRQPFVLISRREPVSRCDWARSHRGPIVAALVDPEPADWNLVEELAVPAILVHSKPMEPPEVADALACGASSVVPADTVSGHFLSVLVMVSQGYLIVDKSPMRPLLGAVRARWDQGGAGGHGEVPELTARESEILQLGAEGHSIRQIARLLGIAPKTVENIQTRLFRKLGVRNRSGALAVADAFGLLQASSTGRDHAAAARLRG